MQLKDQRLRSYEKGISFTVKMRYSREMRRIFIEKLGEKTITVDDAPSIEEVEDFWKDI